MSTPTTPHASHARRAAEEIDRLDGVSCNCEPCVIKKGLRPEVVEAIIQQAIDAATSEVREERLHTCHDHCQRLECRQRREIEALKADLAAARLLLGEAERERDSLRATCAELVTDGNAVTLAESLHKMERDRNELRDGLAFIAEWGGKVHETEIGNISCQGCWCAEQARATLAKLRQPGTIPVPINDKKNDLPNH